MSVQVSYKKQFTFFIILSLIFLGIIEISLHVIEPKCNFVLSEIFSEYDTFKKNELCSAYQSLEYNQKGPISYLVPNQYYNYLNINSDGFRGNEIIDDGKYRIIFLGGSTVFGIVTTSDQITIPALVEKKLNEKKFNVQVINAGIPSATSIDELYLLENDLLKYNPDLVVMYDGWNDIGERNKIKFNIEYEEFKENTVIENYEDFSNLNIENTIQIRSGTGILTFLSDINYKTGIGLVIFVRDNLILNSNIIKNEVKSFQNTSDLILIENRLKNNWEKVCNLGEENSFKTVNIIQPSLGTSSRNLSNEETIQMSLSNFRMDDFNYLKKLDIKKLENNKCKNIIDLRNTFEGIKGKTIFFDAVHVSDYGNDIISEKIIQVLIPIIKNDFQ